MIAWKDFVLTDFPRPTFYVEPIVPTSGIVYLHAKTSVGKSPFTWELARCLATGDEFLGLGPTVKTTVAYLELDSPDILVQQRLKLLDPPVENVFFSFLGVINVLNIPAQGIVRFELDSLRERKPGVVIVNTLRKAFHAKANESDEPTKVYSAFQGLFPGSTLFFVAHDRKDPVGTNVHNNLDESYSGSAAWVDGAQVGLHLVRAGKYLRLDITKSQISERFSISLKLDKDGSHISRVEDANIEDVKRELGEIPEGTPARKIDQLLAEKLKISERSARTYRTKVQGLTSKSLDKPAA